MRRFTDHERAILLRLAESAGNPPELVRQIEVAQFGEPWFDGSQSFSIVVPNDAPRFGGGAHYSGDRAIVGNARVYVGGAMVEEQYVGELMLWAYGGTIKDFEFTWTTEDMPISLPNLDEIVT